MLKVEIAELMDKGSVMYDVAQKVDYKLNLTTEEKEIVMLGQGILENVVLMRIMKLRLISKEP